MAICSILALLGTFLVITKSSPVYSDSVLITPANPEQTTTLTQRLAVRASTFKVNLDGPTRERIASKCTQVQTALAALKTQDTTAANARRQTYSDLATHLDTTIGTLGRQGVDAGELTSAQTKFNKAINAYLADYETYKTALDDSVVMDCANDQTGFESTILATRSMRNQLAKDVSVVKDASVGVKTALNDTKQIMIKKSSSPAANKVTR